MNKIFKVVWSEARNAYVVVSEIAKNHGSKSCSTKKLLTMLIATGVMTCASMAPAMAANPAPFAFLALRGEFRREKCNMLQKSLAETVLRVNERQ